jgi:hypothetical protein
MKLGEKLIDDEGSKFVIQETHDFTPTVESVSQIRQFSDGKMGESRHVGRIPGKLFYEWLKEAGVSPTDTPAVQEVLKRKMLSNEFAAFRVWEGTY